MQQTLRPENFKCILDGNKHEKIKCMLDVNKPEKVRESILKGRFEKNLKLYTLLNQSCILSQTF